jgi:hypothetical protein
VRYALPSRRVAAHPRRESPLARDLFFDFGTFKRGVLKIFRTALVVPILRPQWLAHCEDFLVIASERKMHVQPYKCDEG